MSTRPDIGVLDDGDAAAADGDDDNDGKLTLEEFTKLEITDE